MDSVDDFTLGDTAYEDGSYAEALNFFLKAAEQGDCEAMCRVASMYESGHGTECDPDQSIYWDRRAIVAGSKTSLLNLGITYRQLGKIPEAKSWLEKSLATGDGEAAIELAKLYSVSKKEVARVKIC